MCKIWHVKSTSPNTHLPQYTPAHSNIQQRTTHQILDILKNLTSFGPLLWCNCYVNYVWRLSMDVSSLYKQLLSTWPTIDHSFSANEGKRGDRMSCMRSSIRTARTQPRNLPHPCPPPTDRATAQHAYAVLASWTAEGKLKAPPPPLRSDISSQTRDYPTRSSKTYFAICLWSVCETILYRINWLKLAGVYPTVSRSLNSFWKLQIDRARKTTNQQPHE